ncbi:MAG: hypothetical protein KGI98_13070 [Euryarchaeota archaeon]|nr:hypothetical protein [Euryarchaeota archaeon]
MPEPDRKESPETVPRARTSPRPSRQDLLLSHLTVTIVVALVAWFAFAMVTGVPVGLGKGNSPPAPSGGGTDYVYLQIKGGCAWCSAPYNASDQYTPANFTVPSHTLIVLTITNYDNGLNQVPSTATQVSGVLGDLEYQGAAPPTSWGQPASSVDAGSMSHTFTVLSGSYSGLPNGLNVPVPASAGPDGTSVTVKFFLNETGTVSWLCLAPCDQWSMGTGGFMSGTVTVV